MSGQILVLPGLPMADPGFTSSTGTTQDNSFANFAALLNLIVEGDPKGEATTADLLQTGEGPGEIFSLSNPLLTLITPAAIEGTLKGNPEVVGKESLNQPIPAGIPTEFPGGGKGLNQEASRLDSSSLMMQQTQEVTPKETGHLMMQQTQEVTPKETGQKNLVDLTMGQGGNYNFPGLGKAVVKGDVAAGQFMGLELKRSIGPVSHEGVGDTKVPDQAAEAISLNVLDGLEGNPKREREGGIQDGFWEKVPGAFGDKGFHERNSLTVIQGTGEKGESLLPKTNHFRDSIMDQVVRSMNLTVQQGQAQMQIQLKPDFLGQMSMKIAMEDGLVMVSFLVDNHQVKELLESNLTNLRQSLNNQGLKVDNLSVSVGGQGAFSDLSRRQGSWENSNKKSKPADDQYRQEESQVRSVGYERSRSWSISSMDYIV